MTTAQQEDRLKIKDYGLQKSENINHNSRFSAFGGFTLVEVLVAATILATLIGGVILTLNPFAQINKGQDTQRLADLQAVKTAVDLYYSDNKCYPTQLPFGQEWRVNSTVYMKKVPQDPKCNGGSGTCYKYRTDPNPANTCPQWNVVFAQVSKASALTNVCPLSSLSDCTPTGYTSGVWACTLSGAVNCSALKFAASINGGIESISPTPTPTPLPFATPTPTPTPPAGTLVIPLGNSTNANPDIYQLTVMPFYQTVGQGQAVQVLADDSVGNIISIKIVLVSDGDEREFTLSRTGGTAASGTWSGAWQVTDTYTRYGYRITGLDDKGNTYTAVYSANQ